MWLRGVSVVVLAAILYACGSGRAQTDLYDPERWTTREEFLNARKQLRAYDGAPPVIPHSVEDLGREECAACHTPGDKDTVTIGPPRSHPAWGDCVQCHVEQRAGKPFTGSSFQPLWWPAEGSRQSEIAPPTIPHHLQNRENCAVCHIGEQAPAVLRAEHGMRPNCRQCHAGGAGR